MFDEDLRANVRLCVEKGAEYCTDCGDYHLSFTMRRATRREMGIDLDRQNFIALAARSMERHAANGTIPRVLIAGAADTGTFKCVLDAAVSAGGLALAERLQITIVDLCEMPLETCRRYAAANDIKIETMRVDLVDLRPSAPFSLIIMHNVLAFFPLESRQDRMRQLVGWLEADGNVLSVTQVGRREETPADLQQEVDRQLGGLAKFLADPGGPLHADRAQLAQRIDTAVRLRRRFPAPFADVEELRVFYASAGLEIVEEQSSDMSSAQPNRRYGGRVAVLCSRLGA